MLLTNKVIFVIAGTSGIRLSAVEAFLKEDNRQGKQGEEETHWAYVPDSESYDVPYCALVPAGSDIVWVAGRCFSATHDVHASCRSMGQTMSMGQATGLAAALSFREDSSARSLPVATLQDRLIALGAILQQPDQEAATNRNDWKLSQTKMR
jgi:hypothetical protein